MTLNLDIRTPTIILVADFNPAIFQHPWIAKNLFGRAEGDQMALTDVLIHNGQALIPLTFLDGVAINVGLSRTELFVLDAQAETFERLESVLLRMIETLPHTPLTAIGCNLGFVDDDPKDAITNLFDTPEGFEGEGVLNVRQSGVQLQLEGPEVLNFSRVLSPKDVRYSFNFHRAEADPERYKQFVPGMIAKSLEASARLLKSLYGYEDHGILGFGVGVEQEGDNDVAEATD